MNNTTYIEEILDDVREFEDALRELEGELGLLDSELDFMQTRLEKPASFDPLFAGLSRRRRR